METKFILSNVLDELEKAAGEIQEQQCEEFCNAIIAARRVFISAAGRSLLMMRAFGMRLMQLGFTVYVVGETVTPAIGVDDILLVGSGSGETGTLKVIVEKAKKIGAKVGLITVHPDSTIGSMADHIIHISGAVSKSASSNSSFSKQLGASLFEQTMLLLCDSVVMRITEMKKIEHGNEMLMQYHANLE